ncbi:MAG: hypothetical protein KDD62_13630, partial [Bdellovibrionales bacterium]|nr:hypothetical protein [Bdellovibrionales bacterium]
LLKESQANIILGSDDSAYNPSKLANVILARRPIIAIVKHDCPAAFILKKHPRAIVILFDHQTSDEALALNLGQQLRDDSFFQANPVDLPEDLLALVDAQVQTRTMLSILDKACR